MTPEQSNGLEEKAAQLELDDKQADIDKKKSETVNKNMEGMFSAISTAERAAMQPELLATSDELLLSGGFEDVNGAPLAVQPEQMIAQEAMPTNTNPLTPMNPAVGMNKGIETGML